MFVYCDLIFNISESQSDYFHFYGTVLSARMFLKATPLATSSAREELLQYENTTRWTISALKVYKDLNGRAV